MMTKSFNKVFCIGPNKTGTSSLHHAFMRLGLRSLHHVPEDFNAPSEFPEAAQKQRLKILECKERGKQLLEGIEDYDAYSDIGLVIRFYEILDKQYPGSKFIYTDRDPVSWVRSRTRHVQRNVEKKEKGIYDGPFLKVEPYRWIIRKHAHFRNVVKYFQNRPSDLLIMDICGGEGYEALCPFLGMDIIREPFPRRNVHGGCGELVIGNQQ